MNLEILPNAARALVLVLVVVACSSNDESAAEAAVNPAKRSSPIDASATKDRKRCGPGPAYADTLREEHPQCAKVADAYDQCLGRADDSCDAEFKAMEDCGTVEMVGYLRCDGEGGKAM